MQHINQLINFLKMANATSRPSRLVFSVVIFALIVVLQLVLLLFLEAKEKKEQQKAGGDSLGFYQVRV